MTVFSNLGSRTTYPTSHKNAVLFRIRWLLRKNAGNVNRPGLLGVNNTSCIVWFLFCFRVCCCFFLFWGALPKGNRNIDSYTIHFISINISTLFSWALHKRKRNIDSHTTTFQFNRHHFNAPSHMIQFFLSAPIMPYIPAQYTIHFYKYVISLFTLSNSQALILSVYHTIAMR